MKSQATKSKWHAITILAIRQKIAATLWYVATWRAQWVALLSVAAAALKCAIRDRWIGWDFTSRHGRLKLVANNSFLILPDWHHPNVAVPAP